MNDVSEFMKTFKEVFNIRSSRAFPLGDRFRSRSVAARAVDELGYATHGWRLAKQAMAAA